MLDNLSSKLVRENHFSLRIIILIIFFSGITFGQTRSNLEILLKMVDSSAVGIVKNLPENHSSVKISFDLGSQYSVFSNTVLKEISSKNIKITSENLLDQQRTQIDYIVQSVKVNYRGMFRDWIFGSYYTTRRIALKGNYSIQSPNANVIEFNYVYSDTVNVDDINEIENPAYPFTHGKLPPEPFLSSIYEPVIAIGTAAIAIYLFFKLRSK